MGTPIMHDKVQRNLAIGDCGFKASASEIAMLATEGHKFCLGHLPLNQVDKEYLQQHASPKVLDWLRLAQ
jgi:hypothetical protein